jgi:hypothetical protein
MQRALDSMRLPKVDGICVVADVVEALQTMSKAVLRLIAQDHFNIGPTLAVVVVCNPKYCREPSFTREWLGLLANR